MMLFCNLFVERPSYLCEVVCWFKLVEVEKRYTLHNFIVLDISLPKLTKFVKICQSYDQNIFDRFFMETRCSF